MPTNTTRAEPPDWPCIPDCLMSNFDHKVDRQVADRLRNGDLVAHYPGDRFHATCWHAGGLFHAAVFTWHFHRVTLSAETPEELMRLVSDRFGED